MLNEILQQYKNSLIDNVFSRKEKQAVIEAFRETPPDERQMAWLRNQIFDLARRHATEHNLSVVLDWLEIANKTLVAGEKSSHETTNVHFSPGNECRQAIVQHLESAGSSVRICVFTISDDRISDSIIYCAQNGVQVQIITDNEKVYDTGSDIRRLVEAGIAVRVDYSDHHMHHKFALIDEKTLITGSYNWTRSAAAYNHENILITPDTSAVEAYLKEFKRLWEIMKPYSHR